LLVDTTPLGIDIAISVRNLSKIYPLYASHKDRLKQLFWSTLPQFLRGQTRQFYREHWALQDISFEVKQGEAVGIIGRNGAGKSTLLQIIASTLTPTAGQVQIRGRVTALLELGSGFHPQFTGRENVYLNGTILGLSQTEVDTYFDEIVAFADIDDFLDQPIKHYSSGMLIRLAFAVQVCLKPNVLIIDEALAVGDIFFRQKCYQRLERFRDEGRTILMVTHNMAEIEQFCQKALLLDHGKPLFYGNASEAVKHYYFHEQRNRSKPAISAVVDETPPANERSSEVMIWPEVDAFLDISQVSQISNGWAHCTAVSICDEQNRLCLHFEPGQTATFFYEFELQYDIEVPLGHVIIQNTQGVFVHGKSNLQYGTDVPWVVHQGSRLRFRQKITLALDATEYTFQVGLFTINGQDYQHRGHYPFSELSDKITRICEIPQVGSFIVGRRHKNEIPTHFGVANLPGSCEVVVVN